MSSSSSIRINGRLTWLPPLLQILLLVAAASVGAAPIGLPGCPTNCTNITIPYPFGIADGCHAPGFRITCKFNLAYLDDRGTIMVREIRLGDGQVLINHLEGYDCYNEDGKSTAISKPTINVIPPYTFSSRNKFVAVGCDTVAFLQEEKRRFKIGCSSICNSTAYVTKGMCNGIGCCETPIPQGLRTFNIIVNSYQNHTNCYSFNSCSFAFLADDGTFNFTIESLLSGVRDLTEVPATLDWTVGNQTCEEAKRNLTSYACKADHSICWDSKNGYRCNCSYGYEGNPYLKNGCEDINECLAPDNPCINCVNTDGSYYCTCPKGMRGDGLKVGSGCTTPAVNFKSAVIIGVGTGLGVFVLAAMIILLRHKWKKRNIKKQKEKHFIRNKGLLLQQLISSDESATDTTKIFSLEELEKATNNFDKNRILGGGGHGTVYKGILSNQQVVAIKKSNISHKSEIEQFINEVAMLSRINHRNVVKLYGCCLEAEVPLLVYEFISNGTLSDHLHIWKRKFSLSWDARLNIAVETARALAYLHFAASTSIFHRDVKSSNILLDAYTAKVSDFGASRSMPTDKTRITTVVQGTFGYLDPEYFHTGQLTEKSDVYSFGIILVELLTGEKPVSLARTEEPNLGTLFLTYMKNNQLFQLVEQEILNDSNIEEIEAVGRLAEACLRLRGEERPSMKEVESKLESLRKIEKLNHPWIPQDNEESSIMLHTPNNSIPDFSRQFSLEKQINLSMGYPR